MLAGAQRRETRALERLAWATACLMNAWGAKVSVNELLGRHEPSVEEKVEALYRAQAVAAGRDPDSVPHLGPAAKLDRLLAGGALGADN